MATYEAHEAYREILKHASILCRKHVYNALEPHIYDKEKSNCEIVTAHGHGQFGEARGAGAQHAKENRK